MHLKCDGTRAETRFRLSAKRKSPFKSAGASVQLTTGSRGVRISGSNAGYTTFRGSVKSTGYSLQSPVSPSLPPPSPCVTVCHHISTGLYHRTQSALVQVSPLLNEIFARPCHFNRLTTRKGTGLIVMTSRWQIEVHNVAEIMQKWPV